MTLHGLGDSGLSSSLIYGPVTVDSSPPLAIESSVLPTDLLHVTLMSPRSLVAYASLRATADLKN